jgi:hypothetical protein
MAVSILNPWTAVSTVDPNGVQVISAGAGHRLALLVWNAEHLTEVTFSQMEIGGQTPTGSSLEYGGATDDQHCYIWWWNESKINNFTDNDIDSQDGVAVTSQAWSFLVLDGVDQTTPATVENNGTDASTNSLALSSTSTSSDFDLVQIGRASGNRDITSWDTLTEGFQYNTGFTGGCGAGLGGDATITITGDGIADDMTYNHLVIAAAAADQNTLSSFDRASTRGVLRGVGRGL